MVDHIWDVLSRFFVGNMESFPDTFGQMCAVDNKSVQCRQGLLGCSFPSHLGTPMNNGAEQYTHTKLGLCLYIYIIFPLKPPLWGPHPVAKRLFFFNGKSPVPNKIHHATVASPALRHLINVQNPAVRFREQSGFKGLRLSAQGGFRCQVAAKALPSKISDWLMVLTSLKNISQWEGLSHILWKIKNV